ncbi:MAG: hypothetical protein H0Z28_09595 [Archaeoglobus sp.]|nr:hypothetical protein [Archaeoglobus sp.]
MENKHLAGILLILLGSIFTFKGAIDANQNLINAGIGGVFLGIVVLSFSSVDHVKYDAFKAVVEPYADLVTSFATSLELKEKSVYIPPYGNLPKGGVFVPLHDDFEIDLARFDENTVFITDVGREKEMGLLLIPLGKELMEMYENYSEMDFESAGIGVVDTASSVLRTLGLVKSVEVEENEGALKIRLHGVRQSCSFVCKQIACPICSSVLLSIAKALQELVLVEDLQYKNGIVEISARKIGGIKRWM